MYMCRHMHKYICRYIPFKHICWLWKKIICIEISLCEILIINMFSLSPLNCPYVKPEVRVCWFSAPSWWEGGLNEQLCDASLPTGVKPQQSTTPSLLTRLMERIVFSLIFSRLVRHLRLCKLLGPNWAPAFSHKTRPSSVLSCLLVSPLRNKSW